MFFFFRFCGDVGVVLWFSVLSFFLFLFLVSLRRSGGGGSRGGGDARERTEEKKEKRITAQMEHSPSL